MAEHPIQGLMEAAMSNIKTMIDVNTIVGDPVQASDGTLIVPISTVNFGFGAGGSDFAPKKNSVAADADRTLFGGGCGGGAKVKPIAFLVVSNGNVRILPVSENYSPIEKIIDYVPEMVDKVNNVLGQAISKVGEKKEKKTSKEAKKEEQASVVDVVAP